MSRKNENQLGRVVYFKDGPKDEILAYVVKIPETFKVYAVNFGRERLVLESASLTEARQRADLFIDHHEKNDGSAKLNIDSTQTKDSMPHILGVWGVLCEDGIRRYARVDGFHDILAPMHACVTVRRKKVSGKVVRNENGDYEFTANPYGRNVKEINKE